MTQPEVLDSAAPIDGRRGNAVVVGGRGFIGSHLVTALQRADCARTSHASSSTTVKTVFFVAGRVTPSSASQHLEQVAAELDAFRRLLATVACEAKPPRLVLASSGGTIYSPSGQPPYREDDQVGPNNAYGAMKLEMERILLAHPGVEPVAVRLANIYGPGQRPRRGLGVIAHWIHAVAQAQPLVLHGHPDSTRDYLYIDDAVNLLLRIHNAPSTPRIINAGSGSPTSLDRLARLVLQTAGRPNLPITYSASRPVDRMHVWLDIKRARTALGWVPRTSLHDGLTRTWAHAAACPAAEAADRIDAPGKPAPRARGLIDQVTPLHQLGFGCGKP